MRVIFGWVCWVVSILAQLVVLHYVLKLIGQSVIYLVAVFS